LARHLLGLGNSDGGCIIIGVAENPDGTKDPKGIAKLIDKKEIIDGIKKYIPPQVLGNIGVLDFSYDETEYSKIKGRKFQAVLIKVEPENLPLVARDEYPGEIRNNAIYVRRGTSTEEANHDELQAVFDKRLSTGYSSQSRTDMFTHLEQLKALYDQRDRLRPILYVSGHSLFGGTGYIDFHNFIDEMIEEKKKQIKKVILTT